MYIGNDLQIAHPSYKIIDDISSGFNGSQTSFALQVSGATPVPFPISTQQVMISVNGVVQEPDPTGSAGFKLLGSNIVFSSAPANGHAFFGVINAGADYVTAGSEFPDGSATAPSFTFQDDQDTGWFRSGSGAVGYSANGAQTLTFDGNGLTVTGDASFVGDSAKNLLWDKSDGALEFADNAKAVFGAGSDLTIYHNGTNSIIGDTGAGELSLQSNGTGIRFWNSADGETMLTALNNGAVELYHNNVKKAETYNQGLKCYNHCRVEGLEGENAVLALYADEADDSDDQFLIISNGSSLTIQGQYDSGWHRYLQVTPNGGVQLYYDVLDSSSPTAKFETTTGGATLNGHLVLTNSTQSKILLETSDASDNKWLSINGGGDASQSRGGGITFFGNEVTDNQGRINIAAGNSGNANGFINFNTGGLERVRIHSSGQISKGTTVAREQVHFHYDSSDENYLRFTNSTTGTASGDGFNVGISSGEQAIIWNKESEAMLFGTANTERFRIDTAGQLGIGGSNFGSSGQVLTSGGGSAAPSWTTISAAPTITGVANGTIAANAGVIVESDGKLASVTAVAASLSGVQSGYGAGQHNGPRYLDAAYDEANQTIVFISCKAGSGGPYVAVQAATISGTSLTYGNKLEIATTHSTWSSICSLGGGKYVAVWQDNYAQSSDSGQGCVISVSGTTCSKGSNAQISNVETQFLHVVKVSSTKVVICWRQANFQSGYLTVGTISGTSLSWGSNSSSINSTKRQELCYIGDNKIMFTYCGNSGPLHARIATVSGTSVTLSSQIDVDFTGTSGGRNSIPIYNETAGRGVILYNDSSSNYWAAKGFTVSGTTITLGTKYQIASGVGALSGHGMMDDDGTVWCTNVQTNNGDINFYKVTSTSALGLSTTEQNNNISNSTDVYYDGEYLSANVAILSDNRYCISWGEASSNGYQSARIRQYPSTTMTTENFVGFSSAGYTNGQTATINVVGNKLTSSSLTPGRKYYVQDNGSVGLTAGVVSQVAGRALTSTSLLITM